jgi:hypothetical protein
MASPVAEAEPSLQRAEIVRSGEIIPQYSTHGHADLRISLKTKLPAKNLRKRKIF